MVQKHKKLILISFIFLGIYIIYYFTGPETASYPFVEKSKDELFTAMNEEIHSLGLDPIREEDVEFSDVIANHSIGRYIEAEQFTEGELEKLAKEVPIYTYESDAFYITYELDLNSGKLVKAENIYLETEGASFVSDYFGTDFQLEETFQNDSFFSDWTKKETYVASTSFSDVKKVVDLYYEGETINRFSYYGLVAEYPFEEDSGTEGLTSVFIILFIIGLVIFATIHFIIKLIKKEIQAFVTPLLLTIVAGVGWVFISYAFGSNLSGITLLDSAIMIYLTFITLLIRWRKKPDEHLNEKFFSQQQSIFQALLLTVISVVLAETYFLIASFFDTWSSPVTSHIIFIQLDDWMLPIFTAFIGLSAAITEESIFRHYLVPMFRRFSGVTAVVMSSLLWGILHIGYDMYPWYLYILEFIFVSGPFFYFVYTRYGFKTVIWMHYFYNAWVTTYLLFSYDLKIALVSLAVMLSPFLLFLVKISKHDDTHTDTVKVNDV